MSSIPADKTIFRDVTVDNIDELGVFCIKNKKADGHAVKKDWFCSKKNEGVRIIIACDKNNKQIGFIEFLPSEIAWRPINAKNYLFIQCIAMFSKSIRNKGIASRMIQAVIEEARSQNKTGVCTMSSNGTWMANKSLFQKNEFEQVDKKGRFELMSKSFSLDEPKPEFFDWEKNQDGYNGWHLLYANQCPWHIKSVTDLTETAKLQGIDLNVKQLKSPGEAQQSPSGYGTFSLIKDGKVLADHYISKTRFKNIIKKELV